MKHILQNKLQILWVSKILLLFVRYKKQEI